MSNITKIYKIRSEDSSIRRMTDISMIIRHNVFNNSNVFTDLSGMLDGIKRISESDGDIYVILFDCRIVLSHRSYGKPVNKSVMDHRYISEWFKSDEGDLGYVSGDNSVMITNNESNLMMNIEKYNSITNTHLVSKG